MVWLSMRLLWIIMIVGYSKGIRMYEIVGRRILIYDISVIIYDIGFIYYCYCMGVFVGIGG